MNKQYKVTKIIKHQALTIIISKTISRPILASIIYIYVLLYKKLEN
jgi:hypothetical protein